VALHKRNDDDEIVAEGDGPGQDAGFTMDRGQGPMVRRGQGLPEDLKISLE